MTEVTECTAADEAEFWQGTPQDVTGATETGEDQERAGGQVMDKQIIERAVEAAAKADRENRAANPACAWGDLADALKDVYRNRVRPIVTAALAEAEASLTAERDRLKRGGHTLGKIIDRWGEAIITATGSESLVDEDRDGDWQVIEERLAGLRPELVDLRARVARVEALADEYESLAYNCERASDCPICVTYQGVVIGMRRAIRGESE